MSVMQEDGELLSHCLAMRRHCLLEQSVLNIMRQLAPDHAPLAENLIAK
jgi:hypothetical protein